MTLEFKCRIGDEGPYIRGIDLITLNDEGKIVLLEVMTRPPKATRMYTVDTYFFLTVIMSY